MEDSSFKEGNMEFLLVWLAWLLFYVGAVNFVAHTYRYIIKKEKTLQQGDWFVLVRPAIFLGCFAGWYWILFS